MWKSDRWTTLAPTSGSSRWNEMTIAFSHRNWLLYYCSEWLKRESFKCQDVCFQLYDITFVFTTLLLGSGPGSEGPMTYDPTWGKFYGFCPSVPPFDHPSVPPSLKHGLLGLKLGLSDPKSGLSDPKSGLPDLHFGLSEPQSGLSDPKSGLPDLKLGLLES